MSEKIEKEDTKHALFVQDYNGGLDRAALCAKYAIPGNRFEEAVEFVQENGFALSRPILTELDAEKSMQKTTPTSVYVIGGLYLLYGCWTIFYAIIMVVMFFIMSTVDGGDFFPVGANAPKANELKMMFVFVLLFCILFFAYGVFMVTTSVYFIKLRSWARTVLEVVCWIRLVFTALGGVGVLIFVIFVLFAAPDKEVPQGAKVMMGVAMGINGVFIIAMIVVLIVFLKYLRGKVVREAMEKHDSSGGEAK